jgi:MMPL family
MRDRIRSLSLAGAASVTFVHIDRRRGLEHRRTMLSHTVRLVTAAAPIRFLAFGALAAVPHTSVKIMATGLAAGINLDATVVRALLMPADVSLMGRWTWWLPSWFDHLAPKTVPAGLRRPASISGQSDRRLHWPGI